MSNEDRRRCTFSLIPNGVECIRHSPHQRFASIRAILHWFRPFRPSYQKRLSDVLLRFRMSSDAHVSPCTSGTLSQLSAFQQAMNLNMSVYEPFLFQPWVGGSLSIKCIRTWSPTRAASCSPPPGGGGGGSMFQFWQNRHSLIYLLLTTDTPFTNL